MQILRRISLYGFWALLVYMPFHIFLAQSLSLTTGGLEVWKVGKDVLLLGLTLFTICLVWQQRRATKLFMVLVALALAYGLLHLVLWAANPDIYQTSAMLGTAYNNRLFCFLLLGYGAALLNPTMFAIRSIFKVVLGVSTVVALLGLLQFVLPKDVLTHLGYGLERGTRAAFFIDDNASLPRIMSTLREPNALGAYLLVPIAMLTALLLRAKDHRRRLQLAGLCLLHGAALFLTFSRSAWLAALLVVGLVTWWQYRQQMISFVKNGRLVIVCVLVALGAVGFVARDSQFMQHYVIHSTEEQVVDLDSNDYHKLYTQQAIEDVAEQPLGHGPGTAGLASIRNPAGGQLTENYYLQIAVEVGVVGLALFVALSVVIYLQLWQRRDLIGFVLVASFWGYVLTNMLLHTWSNEAVAAQWWLLAGVALLPAAAKPLTGRLTAAKKRAAS
jgi:hypothetical protein